MFNVKVSGFFVFSTVGIWIYFLSWCFGLDLNASMNPGLDIQPAVTEAVAAIIGVIVTAVTATASTSLAVADTIQSGNRAEAQAKKQEELLAKEAKTETQAEQVRIRDQARQRQRSGQAAKGGRAGTILTSPLGVVGEPTTGSKTLLGL